MEKLRPKKSLGQNFLVDRNVLSRIVAAVEVDPDDNILEVGPGRGALTSLLSVKAGRLVAVELDRQLAHLLSEEFASCANVEIVSADILKTDLFDLLKLRAEGKWKVAANLPYNISSQVLFHFLDYRATLSRLVLMFQKEVGERLLAPPGCKEYGILSVFCRLYFDMHRVMLVKPGSFYPVPKVDSVVLCFDPLDTPRADVGNELLFRRVVKAAFAQRRKTLWNCLKAAALIESDITLREVLSLACIDGGRRGETLSLDEFARLTRSINDLGELS